MTNVSQSPVVPAAPKTGSEHRGSWIPNGAMIRSRIMELRKRRGLMAAIIVVNVGLPAVVLAVRVIGHLVAPKSFGPAGGFETFDHLVILSLYVFGFIMAATLGCTAGSADLGEGMFRHLVITGRSRVALYLARIPAGLAIIMSVIAVGFTIVCLVCCIAAPKTIDNFGVKIPSGLTQSQFISWADEHPIAVACDLPYSGQLDFAPPCGSNRGTTIIRKGGQTRVITQPTHQQLVTFATTVAKQDYSIYQRIFLSPSNSLMIKSGLWIELEALVGFIVGLGLSSLTGQRTISVILAVILEIVITPLASSSVIPYMINLQRSIVGVATAHLEPNQLTSIFNNGGGPGHGIVARFPETTLTAWLVIAAWIIGWSVLGAWRMNSRDA